MRLTKNAAFSAFAVLLQEAFIQCKASLVEHALQSIALGLTTVLQPET
jgi:hypothetical protein